MATVIAPAAPQFMLPTHWSLADLQDHLGGIPPERIRLYPSPGTATEEDLLALDDHDDRLCELEDGILVEKTMGQFESLLAMLIGSELVFFLRQHKLGKAYTTDCPQRILPGIVKMPDVSFVSWDRLAGKNLPEQRVLVAAPDLAVEILSKGNTKREMNRKLEKYFQAGVRLVWYIDPKTRSAKCYTSVDNVTHIEESGELDGGDVLPGFRLSLQRLFAEANAQGPESPPA